MRQLSTVSSGSRQYPRREGERLVGAQHELAGRPVGNLVVVLVDDPRLVSGHDLAHRPRALLAVARPDHRVRLGHPESVTENDAEPLAEQLVQLGLRRRGERDPDAVLLVVRGRRRLREDRDHRAQQVGDRGVGLDEPLPEA